MGSMETRDGIAEKGLDLRKKNCKVGLEEEEEERERQKGLKARREEDLGALVVAMWLRRRAAALHLPIH